MTGEGCNPTVAESPAPLTSKLSSHTADASAFRFTWLDLGTEFQHPVLGVFNPTLGLGLSVIGDAVSPSIGAPKASEIMPSLLAGVRIGNARPGAAGGAYVSLFGGPALALAVGASTKVGAEAGVAVGYRWRWLDVSAGVGYTYDPLRAAGLENVLTPGLQVTFASPPSGAR